MRKIVNLCDLCLAFNQKEPPIVSYHKCAVCEKDICKRHAAIVGFFTWTIEPMTHNTFVEFMDRYIHVCYVCLYCYESIKKSKFLKQELPTLRDNIVPVLKGIVLTSGGEE